MQKRPHTHRKADRQVYAWHFLKAAYPLPLLVCLRSVMIGPHSTHLQSILSGFAGSHGILAEGSSGKLWGWSWKWRRHGRGYGIRSCFRRMSLAHSHAWAILAGYRKQHHVAAGPTLRCCLHTQVASEQCPVCCWNSGEIFRLEPRVTWSHSNSCTEIPEFQSLLVYFVGSQLNALVTGSGTSRDLSQGLCMLMLHCCLHIQVASEQCPVCCWISGEIFRLEPRVTWSQAIAFLRRNSRIPEPVGIICGKSIERPGHW